jgi:hypothetical protein
MTASYLPFDWELQPGSWWRTLGVEADQGMESGRQTGELNCINSQIWLNISEVSADGFVRLFPGYCLTKPSRSVSVACGIRLIFFSFAA